MHTRCQLNQSTIHVSVTLQIRPGNTSKLSKHISQATPQTDWHDCEDTAGRLAQQQPRKRRPERLICKLLNTARPMETRRALQTLSTGTIFYNANNTFDQQYNDHTVTGGSETGWYP